MNFVSASAYSFGKSTKGILNIPKKANKNKKLNEAYLIKLKKGKLEKTDLLTNPGPGSYQPPILKKTAPHWK